MNGPYPIYGPEDENDQNFPMPGDNPVPRPYTCDGCEGDGGWYDNEGEWTNCPLCDGHGAVWESTQS